MAGDCATVNRTGEQDRAGGVELEGDEGAGEADIRVRVSQARGQLLDPHQEAGGSRGARGAARGSQRWECLNGGDHQEMCSEDNRAWAGLVGLGGVGHDFE